MRSRWFAMLLLVLIVPLCGSSMCTIKSGGGSSGSSSSGGSGIAVCNPPSATCNSGGTTPSPSHVPGTTYPNPASDPIPGGDGGGASPGVTALLSAATTTPAPIPMKSSTLALPVRRGASSIPEPGGALLFVMGVLVLSQRLSAQRRS